LERVRDLERRLEDAGDRILRGIRQRLAQTRGLIDARAARLEALSPLQVLARGYSLTRTAEGGHVLRRATQLKPGDRIETLLGEGRLLSRVEDVRS